MEETWELAAVSRNLDQSKDDITKQDKKRGWHWSPTHTRLRYQLFILGLVTFVVGNYEIKGLKLPLGFGQFEKGAEPGQFQLLIFVSLLYLFAAFSLGIRSFNESSKNPVEIGLLDDYRKSLDQRLNEFNDRLNAISEGGGALSLSVKSFEQKLEEARASTNVFPAAVGKLEKINDNLNEILPDLGRDVIKLEKLGRRLDGSRMGPVIPDGTRNEFDEFVISWGDTKHKWMSQFTKIRSLVNRMQIDRLDDPGVKVDITGASELIASYRDGFEELNSRSEELHDSLNGELERFETLCGNVSRELKKDMVNLSDSLKLIRASEEKKLGVFKIERALGLYVPLLTSTGLASLGWLSYVGCINV